MSALCGTQQSLKAGDDTYNNQLKVERKGRVDDCVDCDDGDDGNGDGDGDGEGGGDGDGDNQR